MLLLIFTKIILLLLFYYIFFHENYFYFFMFRDVPECSGMFRVPGFIDGRKKYVIDRFINLHCLKCVLVNATCEREIFELF